MQAFVETTGVDGFDHIADVDLTVWQRYAVVSQPSFVFLNDDGTAHVRNGALGEEQLAELIEGLL